MADINEQPDQGGADMQAQGDQSQAGGAYCIEIHVRGDSLSVSVEPDDEEYSEDGGQQDTGKPAANIKDALTQALEIYKNNGQAPEDSNADADLDAGFKSRGGY